MDTNKSIIRNGNHFIYLDNAGWVLIDGPWFNKLPSEPKLKLFYVPAYCPVSAIAWTYEDSIGPIGPTTFDTIIWETVYWLPGYRNITDDPWLSFEYRTKIITKYRYKLGWRIYPDGKLPVFFNALDWQPEMARDYNLKY